jgi:hypothetical protein
MVLLENTHIEMIETPKGGFKRSSLAALGIPWPPKKGWRIRAIGTEVSEGQLSLAIHFSETGKQSKTEARVELSRASQGQGDFFD